MDDAEPLTYAEAEAVLLALGERLRWHKVQSPLPDDERLYASQTTREVSSYGIQWYTICRGSKAKPFIACQYSEIGPILELAKCSTLAEAKATCERHYAN